MKYRKKPVVIEAVLWKGTNLAELVEFGPEEFRVCPGLPGRLLIPTLEGEMTADEGDFIIKGVKGEYYPCKPDIFAMTYEEAPDGT